MSKRPQRLSHAAPKLAAATARPHASTRVAKELAGAGVAAWHVAEVARRVRFVEMFDRLMKDVRMDGRRAMQLVQKYAVERDPDSRPPQRSTLMRWRRLFFQSGGKVASLLDARMTKPRRRGVSTDAVEHFIATLYADDRQNMRRAWRETAVAAAARGWRWCSYSNVKTQFDRWLIRHTLTHGCNARERPSKPLR